MVCPWPFLANLDAVVPPVAKQPDSGKSFAQALSDSGEIQLNQLPPRVVMGTSVRVRISQAEFENGIADCRFNLHGRITLSKGDTPYTAQALKLKLNNLWPNLCSWHLIPLGRGYYEFSFSLLEDMRRIWALGVVHIKPGLLRFFHWTKCFSTENQVQTHAQVWVCLMHLPQEYWRKKTLFEIASGLGTPLTIDEATQQRRYGLFARILVDVDLSDKMFESVVIESEGHALSIQVQYEKYPSVCAHCQMLGHSIQNCLKLGATNQQDVTSISDKAIPATGKVIRYQNQKVKPNPTSHFNRSVQPMVHNSEIRGSPPVADKATKQPS